MTKDRFERRAYRRSPGRQYGYDYDPLGGQKRSGSSQSGRVDSSLTGDQWPSRGNSTSQQMGRSSGQLAPRPDLRRTRQLLRQNILASKSHSTTLPEEEIEEQENVGHPLSTRHVEPEDDVEQYEEEQDSGTDSTLFSNRYRARNRNVGQAPSNRRAEPPYEPMQQEYIEADGQEGEWNEFEFADPDLGYEDPLDQRVGYTHSPQAQQVPVTTSRRLPPSRRSYEEQYDEEDYADEEDERPARRKAKKGGLSRRKLLVGLGLAAAGGVAAYELGPKIPQAINDVGSNLEHQLQDAYNKGIAAGAEAVRKDFITSLNNLEGISLQGAISAARLTRLAYDAFVSPLVTLAATVTGDFLNVTLQAVMSARGFLVKFNQDNSTLAALQTVLTTWVKQVNEVPKEIQTITDADLDGAQSYLRALQRKLQDETAKLNNPPTTPTPKSTSTPTH